MIVEASQYVREIDLDVEGSGFDPDTAKQKQN